MTADAGCEVCWGEGGEENLNSGEGGEDMVTKTSSTRVEKDEKP